jgi:rod shape-determining protein MreC
MESFFDRYKNPLVLMGVLFVQVVLLATQVKRPDPRNPNSGGTRLIRVWAVTAVTPIERALVGTGHFFRNGWHNYADLRGVRRENQQLQDEVTRLRIEQVHLKQDAEQARRLQALLEFKEKYIGQTVAAQVIGTSGSEQSQLIYIDRGSHDGMKVDMAVITPDGIVGKIKEVMPLSSQVLMINDRESGAGVILEKSRLQGVLRGTSMGEMLVDGVMADQKVDVGERVIASGGDRVYPKGMAVGTVSSVAPDHDTGTFLTIKIKPAADLNRLEEVLVITKMAEQQAPVAADNGSRTRAADILAQRLPSVPKTDQTGVADKEPKKKPAANAESAPPSGSTGSQSTTAKPKAKKPVAQPTPSPTESQPANPPQEPSAGEQKPSQPPSTMENLLQ